MEDEGLKLLKELFDMFHQIIGFGAIFKAIGKKSMKYGGTFLLGLMVGNGYIAMDSKPEESIENSYVGSENRHK